MRVLKFQTRLPTGQIEQLSIESERVLIGSGAHCEIRLPLAEARVEHVLIELGPAGVHVAHLAIDGMIDSPALRAAVPDFTSRFAPDSLIRPEDVASCCAQLHAQPRSAWTLELVLRPYCERW